MLRGHRYRVGEREYGSMEDASAEMPRIEQQAKELLGAWRSVTLATELLLIR